MPEQPESIELSQATLDDIGDELYRRYGTTVVGVIGLPKSADADPDSRVIDFVYRGNTLYCGTLARTISRRLDDVFDREDWLSDGQDHDEL